MSKPAQRERSFYDRGCKDRIHGNPKVVFHKKFDKYLRRAYHRGYYND